MELVRFHVEMLEAMFDDPSLSRLRKRHPSHPAVKRIDALVDLERRSGRVRWPDEYAAVHSLAAQHLDISTWADVSSTPNQIWAGFDERTMAHLNGALRQPSKFEDTMVELFVWGWLRQSGFVARREELDGMSDISVETSQGERRAEVKRIAYATSPDRVAKVVLKANGQIKKSDPTKSGLVYVGLTRPEMPVTFDEALPADVRPYYEAACRALGDDKNRSVAQIVIAWDDLMVTGEPPSDVLYAFRRRSETIEHPAPRSEPLLSEGLNPASTFVTSISFEGNSPPPRSSRPLDGIEVEDAVVTQLFREENEYTDGIRAGHALAVLRDPHGVKRFRRDGAELILTSRAIELRGGYTLLVLAIVRPDHKPEIFAAFKLCWDTTERGLSREPDRAFFEVLRRYGLPVSAGDTTGLFIPDVTVPLSTGLSVTDPGASSSFFVSTMAKRRHDSTQYAWSFAIDRERYRASLRRMQG
jgi:hypothetical protein